MSLKQYRKKRSFNKTPEPEGVKRGKKSGFKKRGKQLRFVVQKHDASHLHYDFRLEMEGVLKSWAVPKGPSMDPNIKRLAMMVEDHPMSYIGFEGTIPKGNYGAGEVEIWDEGFYHSSETTDQKQNEKKLLAGLHKGGIHFFMYGEKLKGLFTLIKIKGDQKNAWLLLKHQDEYAEKTVKKAMLRNIKPMLATARDKPFSDPKWLFEIKWDGYRAIAEKESDSVKLYSRNGLPFSKFSAVIESIKKLPGNLVLDGEVIGFDKDGNHSFQALQNFDHAPTTLQYAVFDVLYKDGQDLRDLPLIERKKILRELIPKKHKVLIYGDHVLEKGTAFFEESAKMGFEGIVAKEIDSKYKEGRRSESWFKIKNVMTQEAVICGFTEPRGSRKEFGALILGMYSDGELKYIGHTGGGFDETGLASLHKKLILLETDQSPFKKKIKVNNPVTWVKPKLVCQIKFSEWTTDGHMRHPIFLGLRDDKSALEISKEVSADVSITNREKIYWPAERYTKGDLVDYYEKIAPYILPYLKDRPENLNRHPNGIKGQSFYQKNFEKDVPDFVTLKRIWSESNAKEIRYLLCQNKETLMYLANLGCIEINPWSSRVQSLENPDYMIIDLDPGDNSMEELVSVAQLVHKVLTDACEEHYCKTSGKRGLHIVVPLGAQYDYDVIRTFAELLMRIVHKKMPEITSLERSLAKRKRKIYLDFLQNRKGQTLAAPYSARPWPGATVSTPLEWNEVKKGLDPSKFTIKTIFNRLKKKGDLWKPVLEHKIDLKESIKCLEKMQSK